jgi:hypothetical protein
MSFRISVPRELASPTCSLPRTLINTLEYSLTCLALAYYIVVQRGTEARAAGRPHAHAVSRPPPGKDDDLPGSSAYLALAALCVMMRPTAALVWGPLVFLHVLRLLRRVSFLLFSCISLV